MKQTKEREPGKASEPDNVNPLLLQEACIELTVPLTFLYNKCVEQKYLPNDCKDANMCPCHMKDATNQVTTYRPISLCVLKIDLQKDSLVIL